MSKPIHVVAGIIHDEQKQQVLIARRPKHLHQGGLWEFPGGKVESGEDVYSALCRELKEELAIDVVDASLCSTICHEYPDKSVLLEFWHVDSFEGEAKGCEGQELSWVSIDELSSVEFPAANRPIVDMLQDETVIE